MKVDTVNGKQYWTAELVRDLDGWQMILAEQFKTGVKRLHVRSSYPGHAEFRLVYCSDELYEKIVNSSNHRNP